MGMQSCSQQLAVMAGVRCFFFSLFLLLAYETFGASACSGDSCVDCVWSNRPDVVSFFASNGWSTDCGNRNAIIESWCSFSPEDCKQEKSRCNSCGVSQQAGCPPYGSWTGAGRYCCGDNLCHCSSATSSPTVIEHCPGKGVFGGAYTPDYCEASTPPPSPNPPSSSRCGSAQTDCSSGSPSVHHSSVIGCYVEEREGAALQVVRLHHKTPCENGGGHAIFLILRDQNGAPLASVPGNVQFEVSCDGYSAGPFPFQKSYALDGSHGVFDLYNNMNNCGVVVLQDGVSVSDFAGGMETMHFVPDTEAACPRGNSYGHHSSVVEWQLC